MVFPRLGLEGRCHPNTLAYFVKTVVQRAGCPNVTPRSLRHFHASMALQKGGNPKTVADRIGHSNPSTTMNIYGHVLPGWQQELADDVAKDINPDVWNCGTNVGQAHNTRPCYTLANCGL